jgi:phage repressor protein C with HTH and peptisase S24 domain
MNKTHPHERLRKAREEAGYSTAKDAADALGIKAPTYTSHENGTRDFSREDALLYARRFKVTPAHLMFGDEIRSREPAKIREVDMRAGAGAGGVESAVVNTTAGGITLSADAVAEVWEMPDAFMRGQLRMRSENAWIVEVMGDSGYDPSHPGAPGSLFPGDRAIIDTADRRPSPSGPFAVFDGYGLVVKLVEVVQGSDPVRFRLISRNPQYQPYEVTSEEAHIIGRVRGKITAM